MLYTGYYRWSGACAETPSADELLAGTAPLHHSVGPFEKTLWRLTLAIPISKPRLSSTRIVSNPVDVEHSFVAAATMPAAVAFSSLGQFTTRTVIVRTCDERPFMVNVPSFIPTAMTPGMRSTAARARSSSFRPTLLPTRCASNRLPRTITTTIAAKAARCPRATGA